jgi:transposase
MHRYSPGKFPASAEFYASPAADAPATAAVKSLGEDVSGKLEYVPEHFKVIQQVRPKLASVRCDKIVQAEAPSRPIEREFGQLTCVSPVTKSRLRT